MVRRPFAWLCSAFLFLSSLLLSTSSALAVFDYDHFLTHPVPLVENQFPGGTDEKYRVKYENNSYKLRIKDELPLYAEVGASVFFELAGLPNQRVYPTL